MSINLKIGDVVAGKTIAELGEYSVELDMLPVGFSDGSYEICKGSNWTHKLGPFLRSPDFDGKNEVNRLLSAMASMPVVKRGRERIWVNTTRRAGVRRGERKVRLLLYYNEKKDCKNRADEVVEK